nr:hypothetical protein GCM10017611_33150 [Rhodococcus wratislaviensis]
MSGMSSVPNPSASSISLRITSESVEDELAVLEINGRVSLFTRAGGAGEGAPEQPGIA